MSKYDSHDPEAFRKKKTMRLDVWNARGYRPYTTTDMGPIDEAFSGCAPNQQKGARAKACKSDGFIMPAHGIPGLNPRPITAQLRPDEAILVKVEFHSHRSDDSQGEPVHPKTGKKLHWSRVSTAWEQRLHILRSKDPNDHRGAEEAARRGHDTPEKLRGLLANSHPDATARDALEAILAAVNDEGVHRKEKWAKYLLADGPKKPLDHDHDEHYSNSLWGGRHRRRHVRKHHGGIDPTEKHTHQDILVPDNDPQKDPGKQLDMNPIQTSLLLSGAYDFVIFVMEGKLKADVVLSHCIERGIRALVVNIPSVSLRDFYGLHTFITEVVAGRPIVITFDADGVDNDAVVAHAQLLRLTFGDAGADTRRICFCPPPFEAYQSTRLMSEPLKGDDDSIAAGHLLLDRRVFHLDLPYIALHVWENRLRKTVVNGRLVRKDIISELRRTFEGIVLLGGTNGVSYPTLDALAKFTGQDPRKVGKWVRKLDGLGVVQVDRELLRIRRWKWLTDKHRNAEFDWEDARPTIEIIEPQLWAVQIPGDPLRDWLERNIPHARSVIRESEMHAVPDVELAVKIERLAELAERHVSENLEIAAIARELTERLPANAVIAAEVERFIATFERQAA